ncbi:MAG TPA: hypothetical protein VK634_15040 [Reyranella sp.]|nr:hypothetical protein [Reyranella sp.]
MEGQRRRDRVLDRGLQGAAAQGRRRLHGDPADRLRRQEIPRRPHRGADQGSGGIIGWESAHAHEVAAWRALAQRDDGFAIDRLLSRPFPSAPLAPYWNAFQYLGRDRPRDNISLGLGGSVSLNRPIPVERIRAEGERLGYGGDGLDDFEAIIVRIDDTFVEVTVKKEAADAKAAAQKAAKERRRV